MFQGDLKGQLKNHMPSAHSSSVGYHRFRDNGELRYSLRALEKFAPWIRKIYIVTNGQVPRWLDISSDRISIIAHNTIFLDKSNLPTFNSNAIELQLHRIPTLSKRFLYFNDDVFLGRPISKHDFITKSGGQYIYFEPNRLSNNIDGGLVHDRAYAYSQNIVNKLWGRKDSRLLPAHIPQLYDRDVLAYLENAVSDEFQRTSAHRFRSADDLVLRIIYFFFLLESGRGGEGHEAVILNWGSSDYSFLSLKNNLWEIWKAFFTIGFSIKPKFFCINDDLEGAGSYNILLTSLRMFLRFYFPYSSRFEKPI